MVACLREARQSAGMLRPRAAVGRSIEEGTATLYRRVAALAVVFLLALGPANARLATAVSVMAKDDTYSVDEDQALTVDAGAGVLANDTPNTGTCVVENTNPANGSLGSGVAADGSFTFTPTANFNGATSFTYGMADASGGCPATSDSPGTVDITVNPVNDPPTASAQNDCSDGSVSVRENSGAYSSTQPCVHFDSPGPSNESSQTLQSWDVQVASTVGFSSGPSVTKSGAFGYLHFTPAADDAGDATVTIRARDSGGTANGGDDLSNDIVVHIHVLANSPPTATADSFIVLKNTTLNVQAPGVLLNDSDPDGDPLTAVKVTNPAHGVVTLAGDGSFSYTPATGFEGLDAFSYKASDGHLTSATKVVSLHVTAVPPVATPTPVPTATPAPTPTPEITPSEGPAATVDSSPSAFPTPNLPTAAPGQTVAAPSAAPTPAPGPTSDSGGGPSLPVLLVIVLLVLLLGFGAAVYVPRWIRAQSGGPPGPV
jgi:Bacterial Ig domain/Cadherin-like domain